MCVGHEFLVLSEKVGNVKVIIVAEICVEEIAMQYASINTDIGYKKSNYYYYYYYYYDNNTTNDRVIHNDARKVDSLKENIW